MKILEFGAALGIWGMQLVVPLPDWPRAFHEFHAIHLSATGNDFVNNDEAFSHRWPRYLGSAW